MSKIDKEVLKELMPKQDTEADIRKNFILRNRKCSITMSLELLHEYPAIIKVKDESGNWILYLFNGKHYSILNDEDLMALWHKFVMKYGIYDQWRGNRISEIIKSIHAYEGVKSLNPEDFGHYICLNNGVLDTRTRELLPHTPDIFVDSCLNIEYREENNGCPKFMQYLKEVTNNDVEMILNIQKLGGYLFEPMCKANRIFFFTGPGSSGKSTLLQIFQLFFVSEQITALSLDEMSTNSFNREALIKSRLNISGEQKRSYLDAEQMKQIAEGSRIQIQRKFRLPLTFRPKCKVVLACNGLPKFNDTSEGTYRRLLIFNFPNQYKSPKEFEKITNPERYGIYKLNPRLFYELEKEKNAIFLWFLDGLEELKQNDFLFNESGQQSEILNEYRSDNDTIREFLVENYEIDDSAELSVYTVFQHYRRWYTDNVQEKGGMKLRLNELGKRIIEVFNVARKGNVVLVNADGDKIRSAAYPVKKKYVDLPLASEELSAKLNTALPF